MADITPQENTTCTCSIIETEDLSNIKISSFILSIIILNNNNSNNSGGFTLGLQWKWFASPLPVVLTQFLFAQVLLPE